MNTTNIIKLTILTAGLTACGDTVIRSPSPAEGPQGPEGKPGKSCSVEQVAQGALISCPDGTGALISNGGDGKDGVDGADGEDAALPDLAFVESIDPCGDNPGEFDEIILKTAGGDFVAYFEQGTNRFLTILAPGKSYVTTDLQACPFEITTDGELVD